MVTFYTTDGSSIVVDAKYKICTAKVHGKTFIIDAGKAFTKRRLSAHGPRLYSDEEFFVAEHGFHEDGRRLSSDDGYIGYATLGLMVGKELLDYAEETTSLKHSSIWFKGSFVGEGHEDASMEVYYVPNPEGTKYSKVKIEGAGYMSITDFYTQHVFQYGADGALDACFLHKEGFLAESEGMNLDMSVAVENDSPVVRFGDDAAPYFEVRSVKYGKAADKEAEKNAYSD